MAVPRSNTEQGMYSDEYVDMLLNLSSTEIDRSDSFDCLSQSVITPSDFAKSDYQVVSPSLCSMLNLISCSFFEPHHHIVDLILQCQDDYYEEIFDLLKGYFDNTHHTLNYCNALKKRLNHVRGDFVLLEVALRLSEVGEGGGRKKEETYQRTLRTLKKFKEGRNPNPFNEDLWELLACDCESQISLWEKLKHNKSKLDNKFKNVKSWLPLSDAILSVTFASVLVCSVMAAPHLVAKAASVPFGNIDEWIISVWKKSLKELKGKSKSDSWTCITKAELDRIGLLVDKWQVELELVLNGGFASVDETAVMLARDELKKKLSEFMNTVQDFSDHTDNCFRKIMKGRESFLEMMVNKRRN